MIYTYHSLVYRILNDTYYRLYFLVCCFRFFVLVSVLIFGVVCW